MKRAVEAERKFIGEALAGDLEEFHTEIECMTDGIVQNMM